MNIVCFSLLALSFIFVSSCATHQTTIKSKTKETQQHTTSAVIAEASEQDSSTRLDAELKKLEQRDFVIERETREYYQPTDSMPGSHRQAGDATIRSQLAIDYDPPNRGALKKITTEHITVKAKTETAAQIKNVFHGSVKQEIKGKIDSQQKIKSVEKQKTKTKTEDKAKMIKRAAIAAVIFILYACIVFRRRFF